MTIRSERKTRGTSPCSAPGAADAALTAREHDVVQQGRRFLEKARVDPRRANIVIQLAESVGDQITSLPGYIDMLLAHPGRTAGGEPPGRSGWFLELGMLERCL